MSHCLPDGPSSVAFFEKRGSGSVERPHRVEKNPRTLCFVASLVTSNNRLAVKSPGPRPKDFSFCNAYTFFSHHAWISVPVLTGCKPMKHFTL